MTHTTLWLAELQFFISLGFMAVFFAIELGLSWVLFVFRLRTVYTKHSLWLGTYRTWVRIFALALVLSFAASIPVFILLGSLWPQFMVKTAVLSSPFLAAVIVATLIFKSSFLGLMLYGQRRMPNWLHTMVVGAVAVANTFIMLALLAWVSWLHHPIGAQWSDRVLEQVDWSQVLSNPLLLWYLLLFIGGSLLLVQVLIQSMLSWQSLRRPAAEADRRAFRFALLVSIAAWLLLGAGLWGHGLWLAHNQPQKAAALAGYWQSGSTPQWLFAAWSNEAQQKNLFSLGWHTKHSIWLGQDHRQQYIGLDRGVGMLPPVNIVFWAFRAALLLGLLAFIYQVRTFWLVCRRHFDPNMLSVWWRHASLLLPPLVALMFFCGLGYQLLGVLPYAVFEGLTTSELYAHLPFSWLAAGTLATGVLYTICVLGFVSLARYVARHGVIPVARHRGRA